MKTLLNLVLSAVLTVAVGDDLQASPNSYTHTREILLGEDAAAFYVLRIESYNPPSYYERYERVYLDSCYTDTTCSSMLLRQTYIATDVVDRTSKTTRTIEAASSECLNRLLLKPEFTYLLPAGMNDEESISIACDGLHLTRTRNSVLLVSNTTMESYVADFIRLASSDESRIENIYYGRERFYISAQIGYLSVDDNAHVAVIPIRREVLDAARESLRTGH